MGQQTGLQPGHSVGQFRIVREINRGATCIVYEAVRLCGAVSGQSEECTSVALKVLHPGTSLGCGASPVVVQREIASASSLQHDNIARLLDVFADDGQLVMVWELINGPDLLEFINHCPGRRVPEPLAARYFAQLLSAVSHIHACGLCHRDLKPENCMLDTTARALKVIDFGLSHHMNSARTVGVGTPDYMAPEMILGARLHGGDSAIYDAAAVDVWGLGIILYLMLLGRFPFQDAEQPGSVTRTVRNIVEGRMRRDGLETLSPEAAELICWLLAGTAAARPSLEQISMHPWLSAMAQQQELALELESELLHAPSASEDLLGAGLTVWLNDLAKADTLPRQGPGQELPHFTWAAVGDGIVTALDNAAYSIHHERMKSDDSTRSAWTDEEIMLVDDYLGSEGEEDIQLTPSSLSDVSTSQETASDSLKIHGSPTSSIDEVDEHIVSLPMSTPSRLCRSICGRELSIAELKATLGLACGRQVNAQSADYYSARPPGGKPPTPLLLKDVLRGTSRRVWSPPPRSNARPKLRDRLSKLCQFRQHKQQVAAAAVSLPTAEPTLVQDFLEDAMYEDEDLSAWGCA